MQSSRAATFNFAESKPKLLAIISVVVVGVLALPVILPHIGHVYMIYHILLHLVSLIISIFLGIVAIIAYKRNNSSRLLFMALGFFVPRSDRMSLSFVCDCKYRGYNYTCCKNRIAPRDSFCYADSVWYWGI